MEPNKTDRRVKYTKKLLTNALVNLIQYKHISAITVKELCELADVNRSTFYAHYRDPSDLLHQIESEVYENVKLYINKQEYSENYFPISQLVLINILEYAKENVELFKALLSENCDFAFQKDILELADFISSKYNTALDSKTKEYVKVFALAGCISMLQKWLKEGAKEPPEYIAALAMEFVRNGDIGLSSTKSI